MDGVCDLLHYGHIRAFINAKSKGDFLIVGIHNNETVESYKRRPIMNMDERIEMVKAIKYVDKVIPNAPIHITEEFIEKHQIDLVVAGDDHTDDQMNTMYSIPVKLGKFEAIPYTKTVSTTDIINRLHERIHNPNDNIC